MTESRHRGSERRKARAEKPWGVVYLVGAGPGDPELLTRRGAALLRRADVVVYDALVDPRALGLCAPTAERLFVGKRAGSPGTPQARIHEILVDAAARARVVVRLKGGDPFIFGRGGEEALALSRVGVPFEVVPGITASLGAAAAALIPLTHRGLASSVTFATATSEGGPPSLGAAQGTLVLYMAVKQLPETVRRLVAEGRSPDTPAALVRWATWPEEQIATGTLAGLPRLASEAGLDSPALVIVGDVVSLRAALSVHDARPLRGLRVVVARARAQPSRFVRALRALGAQASGFPRVERVTAPDRRALQGAVRSAAAYDAVVFTSVTAVEAFFAALGEDGKDARSLAGASLAAFGRATARAVRRHGVRPDVEASTYQPEAALRALGNADGTLAGSRVLLVTRPSSPSPILQALEGAGAHVETVLAYDQVVRADEAAATAAALQAGEVDVVVFPSSSSVRTWQKAVGGAGVGGATVAAIGTQTRRALEDAGLPVHLLPERPTLAGLLNELSAHARERRESGAATDRSPAPGGARLPAQP